MRHWRQTVLCCIINVELLYQVGGWTLGKASPGFKDERMCVTMRVSEKPKQREEYWG